MTLLSAYLPYIQIILSVLLIGGVILQHSSSDAGGAFGGGDSFSSVKHTRRGLEKILFNGTIIVAILFAVSAFAALILR